MAVSQKPLQVAEYDTGPVGDPSLSGVAGGAMQGVRGHFHICVQLTESIVKSRFPWTALFKTDKISKLEVLKGTICSWSPPPELPFEPNGFDV